MKCVIVALCLVALVSAGRIFLNEEGPQSRIAGGVESAPHDHPYQVGLDITHENGKKSFCGGSLIKNNFVMTAAHCVYNKEAPIKSVNVILGAHNIQNEGFSLPAIEIVVHPNFDPKPNNYQNDLALLKLRENVQITDNVQTVSLPPYSAVSKTFNRVESTVTGWGRPSDGTTENSSTLREVVMKVISNSNCNLRYLGIIKESQICTDGANKKGACIGDDGGPLTLIHKGRKIQAGIMSFGMNQGCEIGWPPVYTRVTEYLDWIGENAGIAIQQ